MMPLRLRVAAFLVVPWLAAALLRAADDPTACAVAYRAVAVGEIELSAGEGTLSIRPAETAGADFLRLRQLELTPIP